LERRIGVVNADALVLLDVLRGVLARGGADRWQVHPTDHWCWVRPPEAPLRAHGWKLHVAATPLSAPLVLARAAEVLVRRGCAFKFGTDIKRVAQLVGVWYDRGAAGKFITVYPADDEQFRAVARELHQVTTGLAGPRILSDRPLCPDSLVHYRYGTFTDTTVFTDDGVYESRLVGPDGSAVRDERRAWFTPPDWAPPPFPPQALPQTPAFPRPPAFPQTPVLGEAPAAAPSAPHAPLLGGRFRVRTVIRHANRGGIYRTTDERDGASVLVKQARPHVGALLDGTDVRDRLREEARLLDVLAPLGLYPARVELFAEQGHLFLAEELIAGDTLDRWTGSVAQQIQVAGRLVAAVRAVHDAGLVIRDLKPGNVMVTPSGAVRMIDAEGVAEVGRVAYPVATPAFAAPEVTPVPAPVEVTPQAQVADRYSLGLTLFALFTALSDAGWVVGTTGSPRGCAERDARLGQILGDHQVPPYLGSLIAGLAHPDPSARWSLDRASRFLADMPDEPPVEPAAASSAAVVAAPADLERLVVDGVTALRVGMTPQRAQLWDADLPTAKADPANAWLGAAGGLSTLVRASRGLDDPALAAALRTAADWVDARLTDVPRVLPGLSFGRAGTAWALYDAARALDDDRLAGRAVELARRLPTAGPLSDITHGLAGAGLARLHLWHHTGDAGLREQALATADAVVRAAHRDGDGWAWPVPVDADSATAGTSTHGFAHGIAGIGTFLLLADELNGPRSDEYRAAALSAGDTLVRAARVDDGYPVWPETVGGTDFATPAGHWCNGPVGIGTFLVRLWAATGESRFADLATRCVPPRRHRWHSVLGACCGLAGVGHFLLDLADFTGDSSYRPEAEQVADLVYARRRTAGGRELCAPAGRGASYKDGTAGVLDFLLRLRYGGPAPWLPVPAYVSASTKGGER
jgi:hypothetical protein